MVDIEEHGKRLKTVLVQSENPKRNTIISFYY